MFFTRHARCFKNLNYVFTTAEYFLFAKIHIQFSSYKLTLNTHNIFQKRIIQSNYWYVIASLSTLSSCLVIVFCFLK